MKKLLLTGAAFAALAVGPAMAADINRPVYKGPPPQPPAPVYNWTGWYVGLNAGGTWSNDNDINVTSTPGFCNAVFPGCVATPSSSALLAAVSSGDIQTGNSAGFIGGGQVGYNWQFTNWVAGIEADIQGIANHHQSGTLDSTLQNPNFVNTLVQSSTASKEVSWLGTVRGRLGWLATPTLLIFGTGGLAYGDVKLDYSSVGRELHDPGLPNSYSSSASFSEIRAGWTAGGGFEWMFAPNWSAKAEYLFYDLGNVSVAASPLVNIAGPGSALNGGIYSSAFPVVSTKFTGNIVRAGVSYHF
jgi:outer membrane immunogenic protein